MTNGSAMIVPTVLRGFSDEYGSWKIICISRRRSFSRAPLAVAISSPSNLIEPLVGSISRRISRAVVDLPQPDSPTIPSVSPRRTSNDTPSTARTAPTWRWSRPWRIGKCLTRSRTSTSTSPPPPAGGAGWALVAASLMPPPPR